MIWCALTGFCWTLSVSRAGRRTARCCPRHEMNSWPCSRAMHAWEQSERRCKEWRTRPLFFWITPIVQPFHSLHAFILSHPDPNTSAQSSPLCMRPTVIFAIPSSQSLHPPYSLWWVTLRTFHWHHMYLRSFHRTSHLISGADADAAQHITPFHSTPSR